MEHKKITIQTTVNAPLTTVWEYWTNPEHVMQWNAASDDWHTPSAANDLQTGGRFSFRMEAKDKSMGFDFSGTYTTVVPHKQISYVLEDNRTVDITFKETPEGVHITETFDIEQENPAEMQRNGWQAILDTFKKYVEGK